MLRPTQALTASRQSILQGRGLSAGWVILRLRESELSMQAINRWIVPFVILAGTLTPTVASESCPFCSAVSQTLRQEMSAMDTVAIARIVPGTETDSDAEFSVVNVIRGDNLISPEQAVRVNYFGKAKPDQNFLLMGVDPPELLWSSPLPVTDTAIRYVESIHKLPEESVKRLEFYMQYLEHPESLLARDAYDEFASAPYAEIKSLKSQMDREQLIEWIQDTSLPPDRKRLYLVMLGVCGKASDADMLEKLLRSEDPNRRAGLDSMIACYATLKGADGLKLIDELFLANEDSQYADTYAAIMALRFHGTEGGIIEKERILASMRLILDRPELADLVIPDLARWEDWTQIEKLVELFKTADEKSSWVRVPVINYLRACPLDEAEKQLAVLKEIDPAAYKRATSFFPVPKAASSNDSSSLISPEPARNLASDRVFPLSTDPTAAVASKAASATARPIAVAPPNRMFAISVLGMVSMTLWLTMWLAISGAGSPGPLALVVLKADSGS